MQTEFNNMYNNLKEYHQITSNNYYNKSLQNINLQIEYNNRLAIITKDELGLLNQEFSNAKEKFQSDSLLYHKGVISKNEFFTNQSEYIGKKQRLINTKKTYVNHKIMVANYSKQKNDLQQTNEDKIRNLETNLRAATNSIKSYTETWQQNYMITAPIDGKLSYLSILTENQFINASASLFAIVPNNLNYIGQITIPTQGFGKVAKGQKVRIKLNNYPYQEFGQLIGKTTNISLIPTAISETQNAYFITISLPQDLITTYKKEITFTPEMTGTAEIITEDLRLIERILICFVKY